MVKKWSEVANSPDFAALADEDKDTVRAAYFERVVAPEVAPDQIQQTRDRFDRASGYGRRALPEGVKPSTAGAGRGSVLPPARVDAPAAKAAPSIIDQPTEPPSTPNPEFDTGTPPPFDPAQQPGGSVLDRPAPPDIWTKEAERQQGIDLSRAPQPAAPASRGTIKNSPIEVAIGSTIRKSLGGGGAGAVGGGVVAGLSGLGSVVPGLTAMVADFAGAEEASKFARGAAQRAEGLSESVMPQGEGINKTVASIFQSTVQSLPTMAFGGTAAAGELIGGKVVADAAAKAATRNAMLELGVQTLGQEYGSTRNKIDPNTGKVFEPGEALGRASIFAAAEVLGERFGFKEQMTAIRAMVGRKPIPSDQLAEVLATQVMKEIPGEQLTTAVQFLADKYGPAAQNPKAALQDYFKQALDTAVQTVGQTALMGSPGAIRSTYAKVDARGRYDAAQAAGLQLDPPLVTDRPAAIKNKTFGLFVDAAAHYGIPSDVVKRAKEATTDMPADQVGPFLSRLLTAVNKRGLVPTLVDQPVVDALAAGPALPPPETKPAKGETRQAEPETPAPQNEKESAVDTISQLLGVDPPAEPAAPPAEPVELAPGITATAPIDHAAHAAAESPTNDLPLLSDAQKEAGNGKLGHHRIAGLDVSIETPQGGTRKSKADSPVKWETLMQHHYGYIRGTVGMDGDHIDTFIKPGTPDDFAGTAFVVDQVHEDGKPDEHKVMLGFDSQEEAQAAYLSNYSKGWKGLRSITPAPIDDLKAWLKDGDTTKPFAPEPAAPAAGSEPSSTWAAAAAGDRERFLIGAGWHKGSKGMASMLEKPWDKMTAGQQARITGSIGASAKAAPPPATAAAPAVADIGVRALLERQQQAGNRFVDSVVEQFGLTKKEAERALKKLQDTKLVKLDPLSGQFQLKTGQAWDRDVMRRAAGIEDKPEAAPPPAGTPHVVARAGVTPAAAEPIELRPNAKGTLTVFHGKHELLGFESGEPLEVPTGTSDDDVLALLKAEKTFGKSTKIFRDKAAAAPAPVADNAPAAAPAPKPGSESVAPAPAAAAPTEPKRPQPGEEGYTLEMAEADLDAMRTNTGERANVEDDRLTARIKRQEKLIADMRAEAAPAPEPAAAPAPAEASTPPEPVPAEPEVLNAENATRQEVMTALMDGGKVRRFGTTTWLEKKADNWVVREREDGSNTTFTIGPVGEAKRWGWGKIDAAQRAVQSWTFQEPAAAPAAAPEPATLPEEQAFEQNYKAFEGVTVEQTVQVSDTGQSAVLRMDAAKAMRMLDARLKAIAELKTCIGKAA